MVFRKTCPDFNGGSHEKEKNQFVSSENLSLCCERKNHVNALKASTKSPRETEADVSKEQNSPVLRQEAYH